MSKTFQEILEIIEDNVHPTLERRDFSRFLLTNEVLQADEDSIDLLLDTLEFPVEYISNSKYGDDIASSIRRELYDEIEEELHDIAEYDIKTILSDCAFDMRMKFSNSQVEKSELIELMIKYVENLRG